MTTSIDDWQDGTRRLMRWSACAVTVIIGLAAVAFWLVTRQAEPVNAPREATVRNERGDVHQPVENEAHAKELAERRRLREELERQGTELARLRNQLARKDAVEITDRALKKVRSLAVEMTVLDAETRAAINEFDQENMMKFVRAGVDPRGATIQPVRDFVDEHARRVDGARARLVKLLAEARAAASAVRDDSRMPDDVKTEFETAAGRQLKDCEEILKQPYRDATAFYENAVAADKTIKDAIRQAKVEKSKKALVALEQYAKTLPEFSDTRMSQTELLVVAMVLNRIQWLHIDGKLTQKNIEEVMEASGIPWRKEKFKGAFDVLAREAGDVRIENNPDYPSVAETCAEIVRIVTAANKDK